jgi:hypothetical protein
MGLSTIGLSGCALRDWYNYWQYCLAMRINWELSLPSSGGKITFELSDLGWGDGTQYTIIAYKNTPSKFIAEFQSTKDTEIEEEINACLDNLVYIVKMDHKNNYADDWEIPKKYQPDWEQPYCWKTFSKDYSGSANIYFDNMYIWYCEGNKNLYVYQCFL